MALSPLYPVSNNLGRQLIRTVGIGGFFGNGGNYFYLTVAHGLNNAPVSGPLRTPVAYDVIPQLWAASIYEWQAPDTTNIYPAVWVYPPYSFANGTYYPFRWWAEG